MISKPKGQIMRGPFTIKVSGETINNVSEFSYRDKKLFVDILVTDFEQATRLANGGKTDEVILIPCGTPEHRVRFSARNYKSNIVIEKKRIVVLRLVIDVMHVDFEYV